MSEALTFRYVDQAGWVWTITGGPMSGYRCHCGRPAEYDGKRLLCGQCKHQAHPTCWCSSENSSTSRVEFGGRHDL